jgi:hypothetical protein
MLTRCSLGFLCRRPSIRPVIDFAPSTVWSTWTFVDESISNERRSSFRRFATAVLVIILVGAASPIQAPSQEPNFIDENRKAMAKMMGAMDLRPSGDVDRDFVAAMVPHHQGAIDMALAELRYGRNEQLRRMAQEIIVEQGQEISAMRLALGERGKPGVPEPDQAHRDTHHTTIGAMQKPMRSQ